MIYIDSKKKKPSNLEKKYPNAIILDVTSKANLDLIKLSPFYPQGGIPIPFSEGSFAECVEGIWQGLKVFEGEDVDKAMFRNKSMKNIKRTIRKFGKPLGHRKGIEGKELLGYVEARILIYLPSYLWVLENRLQKEIEKLKLITQGGKDLVLLDYATNSDVLDEKKPLSHAYLVKAYIEGEYPDKETLFAQKEMRKNSDNANSKKNKVNNQTSLF